MEFKKGFTLLLAIVTTAMLLIVSFVVVNVALKQVVLSSAGRESQFAFYAADAGTECAVYWDLYNSASSPFATSTPGSITCGGVTISSGSQTVPTTPSTPSLIGGGGDSNPTSIFTLNFTKGCAIVRVTKAANGVTTIDSRGYNTCNTSAAKRYERGVTLAFDNGNYLATYPTPYPTPVSSVTVNQSASSVSAGGTQTVSWTNLDAVSPNPQASDWVGLYNTTGNSLAYISGVYLGSCTSTSGAVPANSGTCPFAIPSNAASGSTYYFQIFDKLPVSGNGAQALAASTNFTVNAVANLAYGGTPAAIPGTIQAENYDTGGEGVSYHDDDAPNNGGVYRSDRVDLWGPEDGGYVVGWVHVGEWLNYQVNVAASGAYTMTARVSSNGAGGTFHVEMDGTNIGSITVPNTNAWSTYTTVSKTVNLTAGSHTMKIVMDTPGSDGLSIGNINWISFASGYSKVSAITIDHTKVTATLSNFPVLVAGTYSSLKTVANGGSVQNSSGYDVVFATDSTCTSNLSWETEKYVASTGEVAYWVKLPTVSGTTDTVFYMCYGNSSISSDQSNKTAVWDANYKGVWHLAASGSTFSGSDSSSNARNVTLANSPTLTTGIIDGAGSFDQTTNQSTSIGGTWYTVFPVTISGWFNTSDTATGYHTIFQHNTSGVNDGYRVSFYGNTFDFTLGGVLDYQFSGITFNPNTWYYFTVTVTGNNGTATGYILGGGTANKIQSVTIGTPLGSPNTISFPPSTGKFSGKLDEIRLSNIVRSASWIQTEYNNQSSPSTFYSANPAL